VIPRRDSRMVMVGGIPIGGGTPIRVQTMTKTDTRDVAATVKQIHELEVEGCELIRVAVPDMRAAEALGEIKKEIRIPLIADIHFDHKIALRALEQGVDKLRINPGNIGGRAKVEEVVRLAKARQVPIRIGVNAGSLEKQYRQELEALQGQVGYFARHVECIVQSAMDHVKILEDLHFEDIVISVKASDVRTMVAAYQKLATLVPYPLHVGVTESGTPFSGTIKSAMGIGHLLLQGIGDTIRVSLAAPSVEEIKVGYEILKAIGARDRGAEIIACPSCGRAEVDQLALAREVEQYMAKTGKKMKVAVMGCVVNGPGEAKAAEIGIAGGRGVGMIFKHGKIYKKVKEEELLPALFAEIDQMSSSREK